MSGDKNKTLTECLPFKSCSCPPECFEEIIYDHAHDYDEELFEGVEDPVIAYHCDCCGRDFAVIDLYTKKILIKG